MPACSWLARRALPLDEGGGHPGRLPADDPSFSPTLEDMLAAIPVMQQGLQDLLGRLAGGPGPRLTYLVSGPSVPGPPLRPPGLACPGSSSGPPWPSSMPLASTTTSSSRRATYPSKAAERRPGSLVYRVCPPCGPRTTLDRSSLPWALTLMKMTCERPALLYGQATKAYRVLVNRVYELEPSSFDALLAEHVQAYAVRPLILQEPRSPNPEAAPSFQQPSSSVYKEDYSCLQWLDGKDNASVIYVAFGSGSRFTREDLLELAFGLENSQHNFLWVIRPGSVLDMVVASEGSFQYILPEGFLERTAQRGLVVSWAPQMRILAHAVTGAFLSHCGWNSILETLCLGRVPIIAWPQRADQGINKKFIEEDWQVGISVKKDGEGRMLREAIAKAVRDVMQREEGSLVRKVSKMSELLHKATLEGGSSKVNLEAFIQDLYKLSEDNQPD